MALPLGINWGKFLTGDNDWPFLLEIGIRTFIMYIVILTSLTLLGKRGVKQLSVFELVIIISLGSAAGDPMFYEDVGMLSAITVFVVIIGCYKLTTYLIIKSEKLEHWIEGQSICLIKDGVFAVKNFENEPMAYGEFFGEMRQHSVSHLGQIETALIEISGELSLFFYKDAEVKYGMPILPDLLKQKITEITIADIYSCYHCGATQQITIPGKYVCNHCHKNHKKEWLKAINTVRIA